MMRKRQYGRGKFEAHPDYIRYMEFIVDHENYKGMPNAKSPDGRINWQVSSGKTTSFYSFYKARVEWWSKKADLLGLDGSGNSDERFSITARRIHPTGYRPCRLCGEKWNVGYFYLNDVFAKGLNKQYSALNFAKGQPISDALDQLSTLLSVPDLELLIRKYFPERQDAFDKYGITKKAFEQTSHLRSKILSPGFMCNPPDRLDGFHDYDLICRKKHDPGRFDDNMRTYIHDRRTFEWWAEGNWIVADSLYNLAGPGKCLLPGCGKILTKISPDHVGPLACGFKQLPFFFPTCPEHNSAKNRRLRLADVQRLIEYEKKTKDSVASWQVRAHWDACKHEVTNDFQAVALSHSMRSLQDFYLRILHDLLEFGKSRFLATLLRPELAFVEVTFHNLDTSTLTYENYETSSKIISSRKSLAARVVRIAFEELQQYTGKIISSRRLMRKDYEFFKKEANEVLEQAKYNIYPKVDDEWDDVIRGSYSDEEREEKISRLIKSHRAQSHQADFDLKDSIKKVFDFVGTSIKCF